MLVHQAHKLTIFNSHLEVCGSVSEAGFPERGLNTYFCNGAKLT